MASILQQLQLLRSKKQKAFAVLVDPDKLGLEQIPAFAKEVNHAGAGFVLVGGSLLMGSDLDRVVQSLKQHLTMPVLLFPGNPLQISAHADGILFLSLISGRNPELLIGHHVMAAPYLQKTKLEVIPTGYMLVDTGHRTSVHYLSNTQPIPYAKSDLAAATALAGQFLGLQVAYLEGGSGADRPVSEEMVTAVSQATNLPIWVGGGIRSAGQAEALLNAGAQVVVVGNALERNGSSHLLAELSKLVNRV